MNTYSKELPVDAGCIVVMDAAVVAEYHGKVDPKGCIQIPVPAPGWYRLHIRIENTYNDDVDRQVEIFVRGTEILIGDACYHFPHTGRHKDAWDKLLTDTESLEAFPHAQGECLSTGGDGSFLVTVDAVVRDEERKDHCTDCAKPVTPYKGKDLSHADKELLRALLVGILCQSENARLRGLVKKTKLEVDGLNKRFGAVNVASVLKDLIEDLAV